MPADRLYFLSGNFVAETVNERNLEALLRKLGYFFEDEETLLATLNHTGESENHER